MNSYEIADQLELIDPSFTDVDTSNSVTGFLKLFKLINLLRSKGFLYKASSDREILEQYPNVSEHIADVDVDGMNLVFIEGRIDNAQYCTIRLDYALVAEKRSFDDCIEAIKRR